MDSALVLAGTIGAIGATLIFCEGLVSLYDRIAYRRAQRAAWRRLDDEVRHRVVRIIR